MSDKKEIKEIDVASLDSELAAARTLEEGKGDKFIMMEICLSRWPLSLPS